MNLPPTKCELEAAAGWALVERGNASGGKLLALDRFKDGCAALAEHQSEQPRGAVVQETPAELPRVSPPRAITQLPDDVLDVIEASGQRTCRSGGRHRFDVRHAERRCKWCGRTYFEIKGREPELIR